MACEVSCAVVTRPELDEARLSGNTIGVRPPPRLAQLEARYATLRQPLAGLGDLSHGSVYRRPAGQLGIRFTWSTKAQAKTVRRALSAEQADWRDKAIAEHRRAQTLCAAIRRLSRQIMRAKFPDTERRGPINQGDLRLI